MRSKLAQRSKGNVLRLVFTDKVMSMPVSTDATLLEIAREFGKCARQQRHKPFALDITVPSSSRPSQQQDAR